MADPVPVRVQQPPAPAASPGRRPKPDGQVGPRLQVNYYRKMRLQRAYPLQVRWQEPLGGGKYTSGPVVVRPVIPGALVTPAEQTLDAGAGPAGLTFYVTPLAKGRLPAARVEAAGAQGPAAQVPLPVKVVTQRLTWFLLVLTFLVPFLLLYFTRYERIQGRQVSVNEYHWLKGTTPPKRAEPEKMPMRQGAAPAAANRQGGGNASSSGVIETRAISPAEVVEYEIKKNVPAVPVVTDYTAKGLGQGYELVCNMSDEVPVAFYVGVFLLVLTLASWVLHLGARGVRRSQALAGS